MTEAAQEKIFILVYPVGRVCLLNSAYKLKYDGKPSSYDMFMSELLIDLDLPLFTFDLYSLFQIFFVVHWSCSFNFGKPVI